MSQLWKFSEDSTSLLQRCLDAAPPPDANNPWYQKFGPKKLDSSQKLDNSIIIEDSPDMDVDPESPMSQKSQEKVISQVDEQFLDPDFDATTKFDLFLEKCSNNTKLLSKLAKELPLNTISKLIQHIFDTRDLDEQFLKHYFEYFLPIFIKRDNSRLSTDLLVKTHKMYPQYLTLVIKIILKDVEVQNSILNDFILTLISNEQSEILCTISGTDLNSQEFSHNLFNITTAYKSCNKTEHVQINVFSLLKSHSENCTKDKNYGKLLLDYLKQEKVLKHGVTIEVENIVETHQSPFKRLCISVMKEINGC